MAETTQDPEVARATAATGLMKARADLRQAEAAATEAEAKARTTQLKSAIGEPAAAPYCGAVATGDGAALAEGNFLARRGLVEIAKIIARDVEAVAVGAPLYLSTAEALPDCAAAGAYALHRLLVETALDGAIALSARVEPNAGPFVLSVPAALFAKSAEGETKSPIAGLAGIASLAAGAGLAATGGGGALTAAGLVLSGASSLISYFKTDYAIAGRDLQPTQRPLLLAVAHYLLPKHTVRLDGSAPSVSAATRKQLVDELAALSAKASDARRRAAHHSAELKRLDPPAAAAGAPAQPHADPDPDRQAPGHAQALAALTPAIALFDALVTALLADAGGTIALEKIAVEQELQSFLAEPGLLFVNVKVDGAFASTTTEKGFWSSVGGEVPLTIRTATMASWKCEEAATGRLRGAGIEERLSDPRHFEDVAE